MARVLTIEDDADVLETIRANLAASGHEPRVARRGMEGLRALRSDRPDLVLLDTALPDVSGLEISRTIKDDPGTRHVPVILLSAKGAEADRVAGFEAGADDYVVRPFSARELMLRVQAVLRRREARTGAQLRFGALRIDKDAHRAWVDEKRVDLTPLEFKLLVALCELGGGVLHRQDLLRSVWGTDREDGSRTIDQHVKRLRAKLGDASRFVETVRGVGYRFVHRP